MKKVLFGLTVTVILVVSTAPQAQASAFLSVDVDGTGFGCDNSTATGVAACAAWGYVTSLGVDAITYTGGIGTVELSSNSPGTPTLAFAQDVKMNFINNTGATRTITVDFAVNNFTQPVGLAFLVASQTANWTASTAGDQQTFQAWERNTNDLIVPGGTATAITPKCVSAGATFSCSSQSADTPVGVTAPFALTGREVISMAVGTSGNFFGTSALNSPPQVPEPSNVLLVGTGMLLLAGGRRWRKRKN